jgi:two-component sensor histidine kinase
VTGRDPPPPRSDRVVILAPFARDAEVLERILRERSIEVALRDAPDDDLRGADGLEVGAFLLTAEAMKPATLGALTALLGREPLWSAPPVVLLTETEQWAEDWRRQLAEAHDGLPVTVLIRPSSILEIVSAVQSALVARRRQYEVADLIGKHHAAEMQAMFLFEELSHRVKNVFSMVSTLGIMTEASTDGSTAFRKAFRSRMDALSRAYETLREGDWQAAPLSHLVGQTVGGLLTPEERGLLRIQGPEIRLASRQATGLGLVLHELASNARKYGALSTRDGRVMVSWRLEAGGLVRLLWAETGGPAVIAPDRAGFGTTVIRSSLPDSEIELTYDAAGVRCHVVFALEE